MGHDTSCEPDLGCGHMCQEGHRPSQSLHPRPAPSGAPGGQSTSPKSSRVIHLGLLLFHTVRSSAPSRRRRPFR